MSFGFQFVARSRTRAKELADEQAKLPNVPRSVIDFVRAAVDGLSDSFIEETPIAVTASGHICRNDHEISDLKIEVKPLRFTD